MTETRVYIFHLNEHWQANKDHYDNQKVNGLTLPRTIRSSAFTQKLDIEGCDPLALPLAALLYQQAHNHWLRKLAHGREMYLIPTGDIAAVVSMTELLTQLRNRGVDLDRVAMVRARQDGKTMDKTSNTKYVAQVIAQQMQGLPPIPSTDPDSQHELTQLPQQLAELHQSIGDEPAEGPSSPCTGQQSSTSQMSPIHLQGAAAPPAPASFDPASLLTIPGQSNSWLTSNLPKGFANRTYSNWVTQLGLGTDGVNSQFYLSF